MNIPDVDYSALSRTGRRPANEDKALCTVKGNRDSENRVVLAVADGMGGLEAGEKASETVHELLKRLSRESLSNDFQETVEKVDTCIKTANRLIYEWSQKVKGAQVGTTVCGALVMGNRSLFFNVGDSRVYLIRAGEIWRITKDHSHAVSSFDVSASNNKPMRKDPFAHALTRAVGTDPEVAVDFFPADHFFRLKKGDILFTCTDGLWNEVTDVEIRGVLIGIHNIKESLEKLYKLAYKKGSTDNISMAAYRYDWDPGAAQEKAPVIEPAALPPPSPGKKGKSKKEPRKKREITKLLGSKIKILLERITDRKNIKRLFKISVTAFILVVGILIGLKFDDNQTQKNVYVPPPLPDKTQVQSKFEKAAIKFTPDGDDGPFNNPVQVRLSFKPIISSKGYKVDADIYYTLDGTDPTKTNGEKYIEDKPIPIDNDGENILKARLFPRTRNGKYEGQLHTRSYTIQPLKIVGGNIRFSKKGGRYEEPVKIWLSYDPLKFSNGNGIPADVYYTLDGSDPTKYSGELYVRGDPIELKKESAYIVKARVISKDGEHRGRHYSQSYTIILTKKRPIICNCNQLDNKDWCDNFWKKMEYKKDTEQIQIANSEITKKIGKDVASFKLNLHFSTKGDLESVNINCDGKTLKINQNEKLLRLYNNLKNLIKEKRLPSPTCGDKPVNVVAIDVYITGPDENNIIWITKK
jgi:protein phosphatase